MDISFFVTVSVLALGMVLVVFGTVTRNRWGINMEQVNCPRCNLGWWDLRTLRLRSG